MMELYVPKCFMKQAKEFFGSSVIIKEDAMISIMKRFSRGSAEEARSVHNRKDGGSIPSPATKKGRKNVGIQRKS